MTSSGCSGEATRLLSVWSLQCYRAVLVCSLRTEELIIQRVQLPLQKAGTLEVATFEFCARGHTSLLGPLIVHLAEETVDVGKATLERQSALLCLAETGLLDVVFEPQALSDCPMKLMVVGAGEPNASTSRVRI